MSAVDLGTRVLAVIGAGTGVASLLWQVVTWRQAGPLVRVDAIFALRPDEENALRLIVTAYNSGRADAQLRTVHLYPAGRGQLGYPLTTHFSLPVTLPAGHSVRLFSEQPIRLGL